MDNALFDINTVRFVFILGVVLSIWLYDRFHIASGSVIAPAYLALSLGRPGAMAIILINTSIAYLVVHVVLPRFLLMSGRDKFYALIPLSIILQIVGHAWIALHAHHGCADLLLIGVGYVIPGLLAHNLANHGLRNTVIGVGGLAVLLAAAACLASALLTPTQAMGPRIAHEAFGFDIRWLPFAMLLSALASITLVYRWGMHAGGFVGAAYLGLFVTQPLELLQIAILAPATYLIVTRLLAPRMILFGRRKFAMMLLVASILTWGVLLLRDQLGPGGASSAGAFALIHLTLTGLFANDLERAGIRPVVVGTLLAVAFILATTLGVAEFMGPARLAIALPLWVTSFAAAGLLFASPVRRLVAHLSEGALSHEAGTVAAGTPCAAFAHDSCTGTLPRMSWRRVVVAGGAMVGALLIGFSPVWREAPLVLYQIQSPQTVAYVPRAVVQNGERRPAPTPEQVALASRHLNARTTMEAPRLHAAEPHQSGILLDGEWQ